MNIRPLTGDDLLRYWEMDSLSRSVRGFLAEKDGEVLGVAGLMYMPRVIVAFADMREGGQQYPLSIMRMARRMRDLMNTISAPIVADADPQYPNSAAFLAHVGFERAHGPLFVFKKKGGE